MTESTDRAETAIVIPTHNGLRFTLRLLDDIAAMDGPPTMTILVDDGSTDGTAERVGEAHPDVIVLPGTGDLWWSGGVDAGCRFAVQRGARRLLVFNNDNVVPPTLLVDLLRAHDSIGGLLGTVYRDGPTAADAVEEICGTLDWAGRGIGMRRFTDAEREAGVAHCEWIPGSVMMFDRDLYLDLGGFDARRFPQYRGDIDFSLRAREHGHSCAITNATWAYNDPAQSWIDLDERMPLTEFLRGFWNYRSNYNVRETFRFALQYCPREHLAHYLLQLYARAGWVFLKTNLRALRDRSRANRGRR